MAITLGAGLSNSVGRYTRLEPPQVPKLAALLRAQTPTVEGWWSPFTWKGNHRSTDKWMTAMGIAIDVDYATPGEPSDSAVEAISSVAMPGSIFHLTPHGARVVFVFDRICTDRERAIQAALGAGALVSKAIAGTGYKVDEPLLGDLARLFFTPNAIAKGVHRQADVIELREEPYAVAELARLAPREKEATFDEGARKWNDDHRLDVKRHSSECPICKDDHSFGTLPDDDQHWYCFSTDHPDGAGLKGAKGYHGDALDLEAYARGRKRAEVLRLDGYLGEKPPKQATPKVEDPPPQEDQKPAPLIAVEAAREEWARKLPPAISTQIPPLDDLLGGGFRESSTYVIVGREGRGKSGLTIQFARAIQKSCPVVYVSSELPRRQVLARIVAQVRGCSWRDIYMLEPDASNIVIETLTGMAIYVVELGKSESIVSSVDRIAQHIGKAPVMALDYLQHAARRGAPKDYRLAVAEASDSVVRWARDNHAISIVVCSTARASTAGDDAKIDARAAASAPKESGDIEYDASGVMLLDVGEREADGTSPTKLIVGKSRYGIDGVVGLRFRGAVGVFEHDPSSALSQVEKDLLDLLRNKTFISSIEQAREALGKNRNEVGRAVARLRAIGLITDGPLGHWTVPATGYGAKR